MNSAVFGPDVVIAHGKSTRRTELRLRRDGFRLGDRVRAKTGVHAPQSSDILLEGWTGKVVQVFKGRLNSYAVRWSRATLASLPPQIRMLYRTSRNGKVSYETRLYGDELVHNRRENAASPLPRPRWERASAPVWATDLCWRNRDDRIRAVFGLLTTEPPPPVMLETLWQYARYLQVYMGDVEWIEGTYASENGFRTYGVCRIARDAHGDFEWDSKCGVLCWFGRQEEAVQTCLSQVTLPPDSPYRELVDDYRYWLSCNSTGTSKPRTLLNTVI